MNLDRRRFLASSAALAATTLLPFGRLLAAGRKITIGAIYVGANDDYESHA